MKNIKTVFLNNKHEDKVMSTNLKSSIRNEFPVRIGIEVEKLRIDKQGQVSRKYFPAEIAPDLDRYIGREYFESQIEFALPPQIDVQANIELANKVINAVGAQLAPDEQLWPYSCPPPLIDRGRQEMISTVPEETNWYRQKLREVYDIRRIMNCGVHLNVSLNDDAVETLLATTEFDDSGVRTFFWTFNLRQPCSDGILVGSFLLKLFSSFSVIPLNILVEFLGEIVNRFS